MITIDQLKKIAPLAKTDTLSAFIEPLVTILPEYGINTPARIQMFLAHALHESACFSRLEENLNYSSVGLLVTFPKYFNPVTALKYARQPERIANKVYANRMGNGDESSGDGWKFRGHGVFQTTGKYNHTKVGQALDLDLIAHPELLKIPVHAVESACFYWKQNDLNLYADRRDLKGSTKVINGGYNGFAEREKYYENAQKYII